MSEQWLREYVLLALRINKVMQAVTDLPYVDGYYGPPEWKSMIENESVTPNSDLVRSTETLASSLNEQCFEAKRTTHLEKQLVAMETVCRKLNGEVLSLEEEVQRCFDIRPTWVPESQLEEAVAVYDAVLPGKGTLARRLHEWRQQYQLFPRYADLFSSIVERILAEVRRRTQTFVNLPEGDHVEIHAVSNKPFSAASRYLGQHRSLVEINTDELPSVLTLVDDLCHEAYPGHHTEFVMKDQGLYQKRKHVEQAVPIVLSPGCLVSEGLAMLACDMIFAPGELERWLAEHIYLELDLKPDAVDLTMLRTAGDILYGSWCNATFMLREGRPEEEVKDYLAKYMQPVGIVQHLKMPFHDSYVCTYYYGKQLLSSWLQGINQQEGFHRLLTEPVYPSELAKTEPI